MKDEKIKIMYLIDVYRDPYAGTENQLYKLINGLDTTIFSPALTLFRSSEYICNNVFPCDVNVLNIQRLFSLRTIWKFIRYSISLKRDGYRIVHIFFNDASIIAPIFLKLTGLRVIISRRDMGYWYTKKSLAVLKLNRFLIDRVITNCNSVKLVTHEMEKVPLAKIHVIYNGHSFTRDLNVGSDESITRLARNRKIIGIVANIRPIKRIQDLIRAMQIVHQRMENAVLVIVGTGAQDELKRLARELEIDEFVYFLGGQSDVLQIIEKFDVAVLCSESEGLSNSIIEYMHCRVPVVCTDVGGNPELVINGQTGYIVPVADFKMLGERIYTLLADPDKAADMASQAYIRITNLCNMKKMLDQHTQLYIALLQ